MTQISAWHPPFNMTKTIVFDSLHAQGLYFNERFLNDDAQVIFDELNVEITTREYHKAIAQLKLHRSGGPDGLLNEFFYLWRKPISTIFA